jgi:hypothetical protein
MFTRLVRWLGSWLAQSPRRPAPDDDIAAYI